MIERVSCWATRHRMNVYGGAIVVTMLTGWLYTLLTRGGAEPTDFMSFYTAVVGAVTTLAITGWCLSASQTRSIRAAVPEARR